MTLLRALKLPLSVDTARLRADLDGVLARPFARHFNTGYHDGGWSGLALRSSTGRPESLYYDTATQSSLDTELMDVCPYVKSLVGQLECPVVSVRFLRLMAGSVIREHQDNGLDFEEGEVRIHIPVITNPGVEFYIDGVRIVMGEGEVWYTNVNLPHRVQNLGPTDRIHLVIDCRVNDWVREWFSRGTAAGSGPRPEAAVDGLGAFLELVWSDDALQNRLWEVDDIEPFLALARQLAAERGFQFTEEDARSEIRNSRKAWLSRVMVP